MARSPVRRAVAMASSASRDARARSVPFQASSRARLASTRARSGGSWSPRAAAASSRTGTSSWTGDGQLRVPTACRPSAARASPCGSARRRASSAAWRQACQLPARSPARRRALASSSSSSVRRSAMGRLVEDLEGPRQVAGGLLVGQAPGGLGGGQGGVADGRLPGPWPALGEVVGELGRRDRLAGIALLLQGAGHPPGGAGRGRAGRARPGSTRGTGRGRSGRAAAALAGRPGCGPRPPRRGGRARSRPARR